MTFSGPTTTTITSLRTSRARNPLFQLDLFHCILDRITAPEPSFQQVKEARAVLASLARTCRAFSEPSLDRLWSKLDSLKPLIWCYARVLSDERAKTPPSPTEWAIIRRYSPRIRELRIDLCSRFSMFFLRATSLDPSPLMPNLRVLRWHPSFLPQDELALSIIFIQRLLSPSLVSLSVSLTDTDDATMRSFLANYPCLCPNLKSISISLSGRERVSRTTIKILSRAITHYEHLEHLDISAPINDVALMHVAMWPKLKGLSVVLHPSKSNLHQVFIPSDTTPFRNVENLSLEVWDVSFVPTLLRAQDQMFRSFGLRHRSRPTTEAVLALFTALASPQRTHSLRSIRLMPDHVDVQSQRFAPPELDELTMYHRLTSDTFRPLTPLCHLRDLVIDPGCWFSIDDGELLSLARNWPSLQSLHLNCMQRILEYPWRWAKYITFKGLLWLLECCPDLCNLCLPVDVRQIPTERTQDVVCNPALTYLRLPESPIGDVRPVQEFLTRHFPSVGEVWSSFDLSSEGEDVEEIQLYAESWTEVNTHLRNLFFPDGDDHHDDPDPYENI